MAMVSPTMTESKRLRKSTVNNAQINQKRNSTVTEYHEGSIVRIMCENFLTYDSVKINPGPNLNMIIGPNGTGKSSIVCAICLGLGGKTSVIGRASHVGDYVKHGCSFAIVEIELYRSVSCNTVIRRQINKNNTNTWTVNEQPANLRTVEELVANLNIQVGNLCQFLPQDRVSDFARMSPRELLENTEKAIGVMEMYENHQSLKMHSSKVKELNLSFHSSKSYLETETQKNSRLEAEVNNYHEQQKISEKIVMLKKKRPWLEYDVVRQEYLCAKEKKTELCESLAKQRKCFAPLEKKIAVKKQAVENVTKDIQNLGNELRSVGSQILALNKKMETQDDKLAEVLQELRAKKQDEVQRQHRLSVMKQQLEGLKSELADLGDTDENLQPAIDSIVAKTQEVTRNYSEAQFAKTTALSDKSALERDINANNQALKQLQDVKMLRMDILRKVNKNAYTAAKWLENNRDRFQKNIHGPIMITLNVKDKAYAKYVEKHISFNDMIAFVCEDSTDMNNFLKYVRDEQNIKVNTVLMPRENLSSFVPKKPVSCYEKWGFHSYVKDLFTAPDPVMAYLCKQYSVHNNVVGNQWTKDNISTVLNECGLNFFYTENHQYVVRKSRYGNKSVSTRCTEINPPNLLTQSVDIVRQNELSEANKTLTAKLAEKEKRFQFLKQEEVKNAAELEDLRRKKKDLMSRRDHKKSIQAKINQKNDIILQIEKEGVNIEQVEHNTNEKMKTINHKKIDSIQDIQTKTHQLVQVNMTKISKCLLHGLLLNVCYTFENELRDKTVALQGLEQECEEMKTKVKKKKDEAKRLLAGAKQTTGTKNNDDLSDELRKCFVSLPNTIADIDSMIHDRQAQLDCLLQTDASLSGGRENKSFEKRERRKGENMDRQPKTNLKVIEEYKQREEEIKQLAESVQEKEISIQAHQDEIKRLKECWLPPLRELIEKINKNFSHFLSTMGCAGEISIKHGDSPEDYGKYGICIKVKYRDSEQLQELSVHQQSGGERSVATVLYLLALQEITRCPFRCVDEINQGMDSINERKVFELVVRIACQKNCSQYFLLTPKLLPDLDYSKYMTVLCVNNGLKMMHHSHWNLSKFIRRRQKLVLD
ncbi:Structural maintenance of chromosomes protein 5 [Nymphon striatum]|nr:Structural maintenance of chromosomes protein 5 [Nymphon striatum]